MSIYIYCDEAHIGKGSGITGSFILKGCIDDTVINDALCELNKLQHKPEVNRTFRRGHFHASKDSDIVKEHFINSIKHSLNGEFYYDGFKFKGSSPTNQQTNAALKGSLKLAITHSARVNEKVVLVVEQRHGLSEAEVQKMLWTTQNEIEYSIYNQPIISASFPEYNILIQKKDTPGLQVVDLLLWCALRDYKDRKNVWVPKIKTRPSVDMSFHEDKGTLFGRSFNINKGNLLSYFKYPDVFPISISEDPLYEYHIIEQALRSVLQNKMPAHAVHLSPLLNRALSSINNKSNLNLETIASAYLRLFDTLPIYKNISNNMKKEWGDLLSARKLASLILKKDLINGSRTSAYLQKVLRIN